VLNAANEIAVECFLKDKIGFLEMSEVIEECMDRIAFISDPDLETYIQTDQDTRIKALELIA
jgi:1-deoxy-D-xylulose-5-phosphate reductoisomerase